MANEDEELADVDVGYRGRGRPRLSPELKRREKLIISLTGEELKQVMIHAANDPEGPLSANEWARKILLSLSKES